MMEFRDHPQGGAIEPQIDGMAGRPSSRPKFRRFDFRRPERQLDIPRLLLAGLLLLATLSTAAYVGLQIVRSAVHWLHQQPQYQLAFQDIELQPAPPPWLRGGSAEFLRRVRDLAKEPETVAVLDVDSARLRQAFRGYSPWVEDVIRILYPPQRIVVELAYKRPVAVQPLKSSSDLLLDRKGALLPAEDVDLDKLGRLVRIEGLQLDPSPQNRPGGIWKSGLTGAEATRAERCMLGALALAGFLSDAEEGRGSPIPALRVNSIFATDPRGLFIRTAEDVYVLWGDPPGHEAPGSLEAPSKWEILKRWAESSTERELPKRRFWVFTNSELRPQ